MKTVVLEESIMQKGQGVSAGSEYLKNFISPLNAGVVERLETAGISILGRAKMPEFGCSGLFEGYSERGDAPCHDSLVIDDLISAVADGDASFALCNDYTGAVRRKAAASGLCYLHPTYGTVSRYGLVPSVPSMDQIGILAKSPEDAFRLLTIIAGYDSRDGVSYELGIRNEELSELGIRNEELGVAGDFSELGMRNEELGVTYIANAGCEDVLLQYFSGGGTDNSPQVLEILDFQYSDILPQIMQILCCAELTATLSRYDGIKYGYRTKDFANLRELYTKTRTEAFGLDAKLALIIGNMSLAAENYTRFYDKAMRIRRLIKESLPFDKYDVIIVPTDIGSLLPQLCGFPSLTVVSGQ